MHEFVPLKKKNSWAAQKQENNGELVWVFFCRKTDQEPTQGIPCPWRPGASHIHQLVPMVESQQ